MNDSIPENEVMECAVKGCGNTRDLGEFYLACCRPCWEMITTGEVHKNNPTFIGSLYREALERRNSINPQGKPAAED